MENLYQKLEEMEMNVGGTSTADMETISTTDAETPRRWNARALAQGTGTHQLATEGNPTPACA
jgi:hypothetical protein